MNSVIFRVQTADKMMFGTRIRLIRIIEFKYIFKIHVGMRLACDEELFFFLVLYKMNWTSKSTYGANDTSCKNYAISSHYTLVTVAYNACILSHSPINILSCERYFSTLKCVKKKKVNYEIRKIDRGNTYAYWKKYPYIKGKLLLCVPVHCRSRIIYKMKIVVFTYS